jgi:hypothetical protein
MRITLGVTITTSTTTTTIGNGTITTTDHKCPGEASISMNATEDFVDHVW